MSKQAVNIIVTAVDQASKTLSWISAWFSSIASKIASASKVVGAFAVWLWAMWLKAWAEMQQTRVAFENLYWSAEKAWKMIKDLSKFSRDTPFDMPEISDNALKLKNIAWIWDDKLIPMLTKLWDLSASQWKSLTQSVEAFNDAITWEFERLKEFWITAKQNWDQVALTFRWQTVEVAKTKEWIGQYLEKIWEMQGIVWGMALQSQTLNGRLSSLKDTFNTLLMSVVWVSDTWEVIKWWFFDKISNAIQNLINWLDKNKSKIQNFIDTTTKIFSVWADIIYNILNNLLTWWSGDFKSFFEEVKTVVNQWLAIITDFWKKYWADIMTVINVLVWMLSWALKWFFSNIIPVIKSSWEIIWNIFSFFANLIKWNWGEAFENIKNIVSNTFGLIKNIIVLALNTILWLYGTSLNNLVSSWQDKLNQLLWVFRNLFTSIKNVIIEMIQAWVEYVFSKVQWMLDFVNWAIKTISSSFEKVKSIWSSISNTVSNAVSTASKTITWQRAVWGSVAWWEAYLVWENGPEIFRPLGAGKIIPNWQIWGWSVNISINLWWVVVQKEADENRLVEKIRNVIYQEQRKANLWFI